jgi:hypothetical protein
MIWVGWRQQRIEMVIAAAMLAVIAAIAIPAGIHMASVYAHEDLAACAHNSGPVACALPVSSFLVRFNGLNFLFIWSTIVPALAALLLAAPFVLDLDSGTYRLYWTQSITRRRWIVTKLGLSMAVCVAVAVGLVVIATWSRAPFDHLSGRMSTNSYDTEGLVPIAYALFVLGVAVAIGAVWRRTVPALLVAFAVYLVWRAVMDSWLRERLISPVKTTWLASRNGPNLNQALVLNQYLSTKTGRRLAESSGPCFRSSGGVFGHTSVCVQPHAGGPHVFMTAVYQPAGRFWELQGVESAIVGGIGLLLILAAAWWTNRRIA